MMKKLEPEYQIAGDQKEKEYEQSKFYNPKKSLGWVSLLIAMLLFLALAWISFLAYQETEQYGAILSSIIFVILAFLAFVLFLWFFKMKYELSGDKLILHYGPLSYDLDLYLVEKVEKKNLFPSLGVGVIMPGFAKWVVNYRGEGKIFMCATRATQEILIIQTRTGKVGITPQYEEDFRAEINSKVKLMGMMKKN